MEEPTATEIAHYRDRLTARRTELREAERSTESWRAPVEFDQQSVGRLSRMDAIQQQAMAEAEERRRRGEFIRIDAALRRIEDGEFGWCAACGEPIARARLHLDPTALTCIACASGGG